MSQRITSEDEHTKMAITTSVDGGLKSYVPIIIIIIVILHEKDYILC